MSDEGTLTFPCEFPVKVVGVRSDDFAQGILDIVLRHAPDFQPLSMEMRVSAGGNYLSLTCTITAHSRMQLDALYLELSGHAQVKFLL
ncbi:MAG TPA: DUF493 domain-containing protein [Thiobacillaceae bacterium]|nr:DUF493 domain-containing protein [Thiobacillaceae bacterium]